MTSSCSRIPDVLSSRIQHILHLKNKIASKIPFNTSTMMNQNSNKSKINRRSIQTKRESECIMNVSINNDNNNSTHTKNHNNTSSKFDLTDDKALKLPIENIKPTNPKIFNNGPFYVTKLLIDSFSTNTKERHPSWAEKTASTPKSKHIRLITIGPSHYCEKVRWGLDLIEADCESTIYYTEDAHPPVLASIATLQASNGLASMTPMITFQDSIEESGGDGGSKQQPFFLHDSSKILNYLCPFLYPPKLHSKIQEYEQYLGLHLGATIRCYLYYYLLQNNNPSNYKTLSSLVTRHTSYIEKVIWDAMLKSGLVGKGMKKAMNINDETVLTSLNTIRQVFDTMSKQLLHPDGTKKEYLMDTLHHKAGFTAADLTLSALASPLIQPPELESFLGVDGKHTKMDMPKEIVALGEELRSTLAGQHVLYCYRYHRLGVKNEKRDSILSKHDQNQSEERNRVIPKIVDRNHVPLLPSLALIGGVGALVLPRMDIVSRL